jgi:asparagine synthase (glutamine-hydrolysing)
MALKHIKNSSYLSLCEDSPRGFYDAQKVLQNLENSSQFSRKIWGLLCLELWYREFHDKQFEYRNLI